MSTKDDDKKLSELLINNDSDFYLYNGDISDENVDDFIRVLRKNEGNGKNVCSLILTTTGGNPDAGYRLVRAIKRMYDKFILFVFGHCKSTGTLIALGADEIVMSDFSEFGPLDIQLAKEDELSSTSGLNYMQSLISLQDQIFFTFENCFLNLKYKSGHTITTKTASDISAKLAVGLISPISAQIDPIKLGEVNRAIKIADFYGNRLCDDKDLVMTLITGYPSHGFVIDYEEARDLFYNVRWRTEDELIIEKRFDTFVRSEKRDSLIFDFADLLTNDNKNKPTPNNNTKDVALDKSEISKSKKNNNSK